MEQSHAIPVSTKYTSVSAVAPQIAAISACFNTPNIFIKNKAIETCSVDATILFFFIPTSYLMPSWRRFVFYRTKNLYPQRSPRTPEIIKIIIDRAQTHVKNLLFSSASSSYWSTFVRRGTLINVQNIVYLRNIA